MIRALAFVGVLSLCSCAQLSNIASKIPVDAESILETTDIFSTLDIAGGLKEALQEGVSEQVSKLTEEKGFYNNELVKIVLPEELKKVDNIMRQYGLTKLADKGLVMLNSTAEDAVKTATPIFVDAITGMSIEDAKDILMGKNDAATSYLKTATNDELYASFSPVIKKSFDKVGAADVWDNIITKYNQIPFVQKVNPDITDYVANKALEGVYKMIAVEEENIRTDTSARSSRLLKKVFALQDPETTK